MEIRVDPTPTISEWEDDTTAIIAALEGCQRGVGGMFPAGTTLFYVNAADQVTYAKRREHINRLVEDFKTGRITITTEETR